MAASMKSLGRALTDISSIAENPEDFLRVQKTRSTTCKKTLKCIYDTAKKAEETPHVTSGLPELVVANFDDEQIWQQLELQNDSAITNLISGVAKLISQRTKCSFQIDQAVNTSKTDERSSLSLTHDKKSPGEKNNKKLEKTVRKDQKLSNVVADSSDVSLEGVSDEEVTDNESEELNESDDEIANIEDDLNEESDKFFDFTGDSDDDLEYDTGILGKTKDLNDALFKDKDGEEEDDGEDTEKEGSKRKDKTQGQKLKSVQFSDFVTDEKIGDNLQDRLVALSQNKVRSKKRTSVVDDKFFKLADLEEFLDEEDKKEERKQKRNQETDEDSDEDEEDIDMFMELNSEDEDLHYADFFDPPDGVAGEDGGNDGKAAAANDDDEEEEEEEEQDGQESDEEYEEEDPTAPTRQAADLFADSGSEGEDVADILGGRKSDKKSTFEIRQEKLKKKISSMEEASIAERPWQMLGETSGGSRPENSLLQENLQFEHTSRLPPEITEETTRSIEDIIRQRIKDKVWDDVERKVRKTENPFEYKKRITLDQEKSKKSLGEIYEQEYLKQQKTEAEEQKDPDHEEIKKMMTSLFLKLDALSNFHYTPKQAAPEVKIVSNQPAITMEEVAPVSFSDTKQLAPEEVKVKPVGEVKGATEKTDTDKLRERKKKKADKKERQRERDKREKLIEKLNPGLGNKNSKEKALKKLEKESKSGKGQVTLIKDKKEKTGLTSSQAFFTQLQEEVSTQISSKKMAKRKAGNTNSMKAKKLKL